MITISSASLEFVRYAVKATVGGNASYNPTSDTLQFGFTSSPSKQPTTWYPGSWEVDAGSVYVARCLIGPSGTVALPAATYNVWIKITDDPEIPVKQPGQLKIY